MLIRQLRRITEVLGLAFVVLLSVVGALSLLRGAAVWASASGQANTTVLPSNAPRVAPGSAPTLDWGSATIPPLMNYQGYLRDAEGKPLNGYYTMTLRIYAAVTAPIAESLWEEQHISVTVRSGQFSVLLGNTAALTPTLFASPDRFIGVTVHPYDEMMPRQRFAAVPYAFQAEQAQTVPDGSVTTAKIADQAITTTKLANSSVTNVTLANNAVTTAKLADGSISTADLADKAVTSAKLNIDNGLAVAGGLYAAGVSEFSRSGSFSSSGAAATYTFSGNFVGFITVAGLTSYNCCYSSIHHYMVLSLNTQNGNSYPQIQELGTGLWGGFDGMARINVTLWPAPGGVTVYVGASTPGEYRVKFTAFNGGIAN